MRGDRDTDRLYADMRGRHGARSACANGYRSERWFRGEQALVLELLGSRSTVVVDVGCGSGLMLEPLLGHDAFVLGVDFNADACRAARGNGLSVVRGDAFSLPLADASVDEMVSCQFFNQQRPEAVEAFVGEVARVLRPGGRAVLVWRNARALVHRVAHALLSLIDRAKGRPAFPQYRHDVSDLRRYAQTAGLAVERELVALAPAGWRSNRVDGPAARAVGASNVVVLVRPGGT